MVQDVEHVAIIMDGNGRWGQKHFENRAAGHLEGARIAFRIAEHAARSGLKALTLYTFSQENWKRPSNEVELIMKLVAEQIESNSALLMKNGIRFSTIGDLDPLPARTRFAIENATAATRKNSGLKLTLAINYSARREVLDAVAEACKAGFTPDHLSDENVDRFLPTHRLGPVDAILRTGGEKRLSNFLLWQAAYAELVFTDTLWPEFTTIEFDSILFGLGKRERKFGGLAIAGNTRRRG